ncbi:ATP-binding protein [Neobacillus kokaensis]|uniref:histidine kinase n=1 Tax=Neobacillus kokaensis TaxID=2759023 RepID=A0ABQ3NB63_9BACI|nr:ATP-binding protein [Neobacillus kokaensis]GHI01140.1 sensor histidine kinase GlnK [Neobacillus kokaensis]
MVLLTERFFRHNWLVIMVTALLTALAGEVKLVPFDGDLFRFGLGSVTFFLLILIWPPVSVLKTGTITGLTVVCFRLVWDLFFENIPLTDSLINHLPAFLFYFLFALGLHIIKVNRYKTRPFVLGAWAALFEFIGNGAEELIRQELLYKTNLSYEEWAIVAGVALLRSYFAVGLYGSIIVSEQKKRMEEMLQVGAELYVETLYLEKSIDHIERITASSHDLYRKLKQDRHDLGLQALHIAQEIHEVKKDSQRILSGLTKITEQKRENDFSLSDLVHLIVLANERYSERLKKEITFHVKQEVHFKTDLPIPLLALLNNLTANAVESIVESGEIQFDIVEKGGEICFSIKDTGMGIPEEDVSIVFEPGYTTKFNEKGVAATGIGLSHVLDIVQAFQGRIQIETPKTGTIFHVCLPVNSIRKRGD